MNQKELPETNKPPEGKDTCKHYQVGPVYAGPLLIPGTGKVVGEALQDCKIHERRNAEQNYRIARESVAQSIQRRQLQVLRHCDRVDVSVPTTIQISCCGVVQGVLSAPRAVRGHHEDAQCEPDHIIEFFGLEECPVAAVVLQNIQPDHQSSCRH